MPLVRGHYPVTSPNWLRNGSPSGVLRESVERLAGVSDLDPLTTQVMLAVALPLQVGDLISTLTWISGDTAANTPTNQWSALYSSAGTPALISQSADATTGAWAANTAKAFDLADPYLVEEAGIFYAALMVKATDLPTLVGVALQAAEVSDPVVSGQAVLAQTSGSGLTDTAPATIASPTTIAAVPYVVAT